MTEFDQYLDRFLAFLNKERLSARTRLLYRGDLNSFRAWFEQTYQETFNPVGVLRADVRAWQNDMRKTIRPATLNRRLSALRAFYGWAERQGLVSLNPANGIRGIRPEKADPVIIEAATLESVLRLARQEGSLRDRAILEILADAGLRPREICALLTGDALSERGKHLLSIRAGNDPRLVEMSPRAWVALQDYLRQRGPENPSTPLFISHRQQAITPFIVWHIVKDFASRAGRSTLTPRHIRMAAIARRLSQPGVDLLSASVFFGEKDLNRLAQIPFRKAD